MKRRNQQYIIENYGALSAIVFLRDFILTVLVWALYFYLMWDVFLFVRDLVSWTMAGFDDARQYASFRNVSAIASYTIVLNLICLVFMVWSAYNILMFGSKNRRRTPKPVSTAEMADVYHVQPRVMSAWQKADTIIIHHDARGRLTDVKVG